MNSNAINWFEIPATDLGRAQSFYAQVLNTPLQRETMCGQEMAIFPHNVEHGAGGCVVQSQDLSPSQSGAVIYLSVADSIDAALERTSKAGGRVALGKTALSEGMGHYAHIIDSEGNRIGLHAV